MDIRFTLYNEEAVKRLQKENPDILPEYSIDAEKDLAYNKKQVNAAITSAILQGKSIPNIASDLSTRMKTTNQQTAVKAARTAVTSAQNGGRLESFYKAKEMGIDVKKKWMATLDSRTRPRHRELDGEIREVEEAFSNGLMYPGDSSGSASEVWWCRCRLGKYLPDVDMSDAERWSRDPETGEAQYVSNMTYKTWAAFKEYNNANVSDFSTALISAKATQGREAAWRVTAMDAGEFKAEHEGASCHVTEGGSTAALTTDLDIVSVCKKIGDALSGKEILAQAVAAGGNKLDSYEGNHRFYVKCGFEPVSWCEWDSQYAPVGWPGGKEFEEAIIFYKYTGKTSQYKTAREFKSAVAASADYDEARRKRDYSLRGAK